MSLASLGRSERAPCDQHTTQMDGPDELAEEEQVIRITGVVSPPKKALLAGERNEKKTARSMRCSVLFL